MIRDRETAAGGSVSIQTDITELKRAEERLMHQKAVLEATMENMDQGISMFDADLNAVAFNSKFFSLLDLPDDRFSIGDSIEKWLRFNAERGEYGPGDIAEQVSERVELARQFVPHQFERVRPDGLVLEVIGNPVESGGFVTTYTDITERKRSEEALRKVQEQAEEAEARLMDAVENISEGFVLYDADDRLVLCNKTFRDFWGYSDTEAAPGVHWQELDRLDVERGKVGSGSETYEPRRVEWRQQRQRPDVGRLSFIGVEVQFTDGRWPLTRDRKTAAGGNVSIQTDITERKHAEAALLKAKRRAEEASTQVAEKNQMLESLSNQLSKYLSPQVYASIFSGEQSVEIASERKKLTVFFSDIADFAGTTESLESEELTNLLNHYLTEMSKIALDYGATIDK